jgi:tetratricopeptide (TPR) repeat protein
MNKHITACILIVFALSAFLISCGGKTSKLPPIVQETINYNVQAEASFARGDYEKAIRFYRTALMRSRSIENVEMMGLNMLNLSAVYRVSELPQEAHKLHAEVLDDPIYDYSSSVLAEAALQRAMLFMDNGSITEAADWGRKALSSCTGKCRIEGKINNFLARLKLIGNKYTLAYSLAKEGLGRSRSEDDTFEEANSLRLMADASLALKHNNDAYDLYSEALALDKANTASSKISLDLLGMARAKAALLDLTEARKLYIRAASVSAGGGDIQEAEAIAIEMKKLSAPE